MRRLSIGARFSKYQGFFGSIRLRSCAKQRIGLSLAVYSRIAAVAELALHSKFTIL
jgi:hypothetical protein